MDHGVYLMRKPETASILYVGPDATTMGGYVFQIWTDEGVMTTECPIDESTFHALLVWGGEDWQRDPDAVEL